MNDRSTFELRLAASLQAYAEGAPIDVQPSALAGAIAAGNRRRRLSIAWPRIDRRWMVAGLLALLLAGLLAGLYIGSRHPDPIKRQGALLLTNGTYECQSLYRVELATGSSDRLLDCVDRLVLSPDGTRVAYRDPAGLGLINLADNSRTTVPGTEGLVTTPVHWSPRGTYLHWVAGDTLTGQTDHAFIGSLDDIKRTELLGQAVGGGYYCCVIWSSDESAAGYPTESQVLVGAGDGSNATQVSEGPILALSSDGSQFLVQVDGDILIGDRTGSHTNVTNFPTGTSTRGAVWSDDGTLVIVSATRPDEIDPLRATSDDLWVYAPDGTQRHFGLHLGDTPAADVGSIISSPDGTRVVVDFVPISFHREPTDITGRFMISTQDGSITPMAAAQDPDAGGVPAFSPDGSMLAVMTGPNGEPGLNVTSFNGAPPLQIEELGGGPWTQFAWVP